MKSSSTAKAIIAIAIATLGALLLPRLAQAAALNGAWLISPKEHDFLIETGVLAAEYPLLVIDTNNSQFRLYRFGVACNSDPYILTQSSETKKPCIDTSEISSLDNLTGLAILVSSGHFNSTRNSIKLISDNPDYTKDIIFSPKIPTLSPEKRIKHLSIYTEILKSTLYTITSKDNLLMKSTDNNEISFNKVNLNTLVDIGSTFNSIGFSYGQYFRCATNNLKNQELFKLARSFQSTSNKIEALLYQLSKNYSDEGFNLLEKYKQEISDMDLDVGKRFGFAHNKLGAFMGCPDRDRNF
jgi:hypothetical protein